LLNLFDKGLLGMVRKRKITHKLYSTSPEVYQYGEVILVGLTVVFSLGGLVTLAIISAISAIVLGCVGIYFGRKSRESYILPKYRFNSAICQSINTLIQTFCSSKKIPLPSGGTRITLFKVESSKGMIKSIGRYSWGVENFSVPNVSFTLGEGMMGYATKSGEDVILEGLPDVNIEPKRYYQILMKYNLSKNKIQSLRTQSRAFYNFPIRTYRKGLEAVRFALCIDTDQPNLIVIEHQEELFQLIKSQLRIVGDIASVEE
jgi:hypothetical protein